MSSAHTDHRQGKQSTGARKQSSCSRVRATYYIIVDEPGEGGSGLGRSGSAVDAHVVAGTIPLLRALDDRLLFGDGCTGKGGVTLRQGRPGGSGGGSGNAEAFMTIHMYIRVWL